MKLSYFKSLLLLLIPTIIISSFVLKPHFHDTQLILGFIALMIGTSISYWLGIRDVVKDIAKDQE